MGRAIIVGVMASLGALAACAQIVGIGDVPEPNASNASDANASDASPNLDGGVGDTSLPPFDAAGCDACSGIPAGWTPVIFSTTQGACPNGYSTASVGRADAIVGASACDCYASNQVPPTCTSGMVTVQNGCSGGTVSFNVSDGGCASFAAITLATSAVFTVPDASGGSCTPAASTNPSALSSSGALTCVASGCPDAICLGGAAPSGFTSCIETDGDHPCPSASPFSTRHPIADTYVLDCSGACTTCAVTATCSNGSLNFNDSCGGGFVTAITKFGMCTSTFTPGAQVSGATYAAAMQNPQYVASGPKTGAATPTNPKTVCCR